MLLLVGVGLVLGPGRWRPRLAWPLAFGALLVVFAACVRLLLSVLRAGPVRHTLAGWPAPIGIELVADGLAAFVVTVVTGIGLLVTLYAREAVRRETPAEEAPFLGMFLVLLLGLSGIVLTGDLFNLYVFFEISALAGYALMAVGDRRAVVSSFRYLIMGTLGASLYLLGVGFLYTLTGSLNMADVAQRLPALGTNPALLVSLAMIVTGVGLKMALFPMHGWLPDAYTWAANTTSAIVAPVMTKVSAYVLLRVLFFVYGAELVTVRLPVGSTLAWLAAAGVVVGSVMAIAQADAKRMLAYSSIAQVSYIGIGIGLGSPVALVGAMLHVLNHATMKCCLFLVTGSVTLATGRTSLADWAGLGRHMPWTFAGFTLAALAMVGVPPTNGFFSKWYLVLGGIEAGAWGLVAVIVTSSLLTAVYFFRVLEQVYATPAPDVRAYDPGLAVRVPILVLGAGVLVLGLGNAWFVTHVLAPALPASLRLGAT
jgi:multicomponent Na+:H+ antiporter subunit D